MSRQSIAGKCAVIVAHPDDETLWAGGTMLMHADCQWTVVTLCRKSDPDRAPRFFEALKKFNASGAMGDLDDGPDQDPLPNPEVQDCIMEMLPSDCFDIIFKPLHSNGKLKLGIIFFATLYCQNSCRSFVFNKPHTDNASISS